MAAKPWWSRWTPAAGRTRPGEWEVFTHGGRKGTDIDAIAWCVRMAELGAGEILLTSMDRDGAAGAPIPDGLLIWVYDDTGVLWNGTRIPADGSLLGANGSDLGTILIQPGAIQGALRVHIRAYASSARILDGVLDIPTLAGTSRVFDVLLTPDVPADVDGDDVPDLIDDCSDGEGVGFAQIMPKPRSYAIPCCPRNHRRWSCFDETAPSSDPFPVAKVRSSSPLHSVAGVCSENGLCRRGTTDCHYTTGLCAKAPRIVVVWTVYRVCVA